LTIVIDASVSLSWCFEDEARPKADLVLEQVVEEGGIVPSLWRLEMANVLIHAERRSRISSAAVDARLRWLGELQLEEDGESSRRAWAETTALGRAERLTAYDAAYLELAIRRNASLATRDRALADAALRRGVDLVWCD
jgi:predicted nucleic acid-binding protein